MSLWWTEQIHLTSQAQVSILESIFFPRFFPPQLFLLIFLIYFNFLYVCPPGLGLVFRSHTDQRLAISRELLHGSTPLMSQHKAERSSPEYMIPSKETDGLVSLISSRFDVCLE